MSFASNARAEMARELCQRDCCARAELAAALLASGGIAVRFGGGALRYTLTVTATEAAVVRHYFQLLKHRFGVTAQIVTLKSNSLSGVTRYRLLIPEDDAGRLLEEIGLKDEEALFGVRAVPGEGIADGDCCRKAFLKSAFMLSGALTNPEVEYHFEIGAPSADFAEFVVKILQYYDISAKSLCRKAKNVVYLKKGSDIADLLTLMGASQAVLAMQNVQVKKEVSNRVNRQFNCDAANIGRTAATAVRQLEDIQYIDQEIGLDKLPASLREIALLRLEKGSASLSDLGELLKKPLSKSGVNARMRRITEIADKLRAGEEIEL